MNGRLMVGFLWGCEGGLKRGWSRDGIGARGSMAVMRVTVGNRARQGEIDVVRLMPSKREWGVQADRAYMGCCAGWMSEEEGERRSTSWKGLWWRLKGEQRPASGRGSVDLGCGLVVRASEMH
jgi:hypothetical protein